ncbi:carotenoid oxygenase [Heliocybe sulcata]|uniref:Carotenoid oxygenase n=1 Tax=Heliocybe sulcata TaxID=5364 RepID=A0A5C3MN95_9AGAM|nr:carotenoid oxygenase [Heliocybe sulcata]
MAKGIAVGYENAVEQREPVNLRVTGTIPSWLTGRLYRTGPGTFDVPSSKAASGVVNLKHWFDGLGMSHCFEITPSGEVTYRNHSTALGLQSLYEEAGKVPGVTFGQQDPCETIFSKFFTAFKQLGADALDQRGPDGVNVSVTLTPDMPGFASHHAAPSGSSSGGPRYIISKSDYNALQMLDPDTLRPLHAYTYESLDPRLDGSTSAAHSCLDKETREFYNFTLKFGSAPTYKVFRIRPLSTPDPESGKDYEVDILAEIKNAPAAYIHALTMTEKYVVLCLWQAEFTFVEASIGKWKSKQPSTFYVIDRHAGGIVAKYETPPFFAFHYINAYDSNDDVVIDLAVYDDHRILGLLQLETLRSGAPTPLARARRFVLHDVRNQSPGTTRQAKVVYTLPPSSSIELSTVHPALYHKPYRYAYGMNKEDFSKSAGFADRIIKLDMSAPDSEPKTWSIPGIAPGEPIFVPRPGSSPETQEDDGILLSVVLDGETQKSMLVMLDAKDMKEVARAQMDTHFPFGFHGVFSAPRA